MAVLKNRAKMSTSTTGAGTITLGSAESGYQTFADAGVSDGDVVRYVIEDGTAWEIGSGTVDESSNSDAALSLTGSAVVFIGAAAGDIPDLYEDNRGVGQAYTRATGSDAVAIGYATLASGDSSIAAGYTADATGPGSNAFGYSAQALGTFSTAIGRAYSSGSGSFAANIDTNSSSYGAQNTDAIAIGKNAKATLANSVAIGTNALSETAGLMALGGSTTTVKISGAYTLPTSDGTNGQVLTTDGSGAVTFADAGGGGGADLYAAETTGSTDPTATGTLSLAIGSNAQSDGNQSVAIGVNAVSGLRGVSIGQQAGNSTASGGDYNISVGFNSAYYLTTGDNNVAVGRNALQSSNLDKLTGSSNVGVGYLAGSKVASGSFNTFLGIFAGNSVTTGSNNVSIGYNSDCSASTSSQTAVGYNAQAAGSQATALTYSYASGADSFAAAIANNTSSYGATGTNSIAMGYQTKATGEAAVKIGRLGTIAGDYSVGLGNGGSTTSSGSYSVALQATYINAPYSLGFGSESQVDSGHDRSIVLGRGAKSRTKGGVHFGGYNAQYAGQNQAGIYILLSDTTDATAEALTTNNSAASTDNQVMLNNNSVYSFHGTVVARQDATDGSACAAWEVKGLIRREGSASATTLVNSAITVIDNTPSWGLALSADTTNGCLKVQATGAAATNIKFLATIYTTELTYN